MQHHGLLERVDVDEPLLDNVLRLVLHHRLTAVHDPSVIILNGSC